jgi:hypothetical protein
MNTLIVNTESKSEFKFLTNLLKKLNFDARILSEEEQEDIFDILSIQAIKEEETIDFNEFAKSQG